MSSGIALASVLMGFSKNIRGNFLSYLFGSITGISNQDIYIMIALSIIIFAFWRVNYYKLFHMAFDEESAKAMGIKTDKLGKIFIILIALCVVVSMRIVGVLLISSMMVIPVAAAMQYSLSFKQTIISSIIIAVISYSLNIKIRMLRTTFPILVFSTAMYIKYNKTTDDR